MYLIPRMIGIGTYLSLLILVYLFITILKPYYHRAILITYLILLTLIGFNHVPPTGSDSFRTIPYVQLYGQVRIDELVSLMKNSATPIMILYYHILSFLHNDGALIGVSVLIIYMILFYIIIAISKDKERNIEVSTVMLWLMSSSIFGASIDNVRTPLALSIIVLCIFREYIQNKSIIRNLPLYLIAGSIHIFGFAVFIMRLLLLLFEKEDTVIKKFRNVVLVILSGGIISIYGYNQLNTAINKGIAYLTNDAYTYFWEIVVALINIFLLIYSIYMYKSNSVDMDRNVYRNNYLRLISFTIVISLMILPFDYNIFYRLNVLLSMLAPILCSLTLDVLYKDSTKYRNTISTITVCCAMMLIITCTRGNLCSLKFFM